MKNLIKNYENRAAELRKKLNNGLSAEVETQIKDAIATLESTIEALKADDADHSAEDAIKAMIDQLNAKMDALSERMDTAQNNIGTNGEDYLKSKNSVHDWLDAIRSSRNNHAAFDKAWGAILSKNNVSFEEGAEGAYMPEAVRGKIEDAWNKQFNWLNKLNNTGAKAYKTRSNESDQDAETSRAKGHTKGNTKTEQTLTFNAKTVTAQFIYKLIYLDNETIWNDDGKLVDYITNELFTQWMYEVQRAILVGDGRLSNSPHKINSVESILRSATDAYVTVDNVNASNDLFDEIMNKVILPINTDDGSGIILFMSKADKMSLRRTVLASGGSPIYISDDELKARLGVDDIIEVSYLAGSSVKVIGMRPSKYVTVGSINPRFDTWEVFEKNQQGYRVEVPFGGAVEGLKSAAVLKTAIS